MKPKILIAMPVVRCLTNVQTTESIFNTANYLRNSDVACQFSWIEGGDVSMQRDELAAQFIDSDCTHLLFWDSDMAAPPDLCSKLLSFDREVVAVIAPHRSLRLDLVKNHIDAGKSADSAIAASYEFNIMHGDVRQDGQLFEVPGIGTGFMLIKRECFERVSRLVLKKYPSRMRRGKTNLGFFERKEDHNGPIQEDWSFCLRVREAGGKVFGFPGVTHHFGVNGHSASFLCHLKARGIMATADHRS